MKRIGALNGMRLLVLSLIFQSAGAAQEIKEAPSSIQRTSPPDASLDSYTGRIEQDTTWRDTVYVGGDVTGLRCLYAKMGGLVRMDHIAFVNCGKPTVQVLSQRSVASDRVQVDSGHAASGLRAMPDSLLGRTAKGNERGTGKRIVKKLGTGALGGALSGFLLEQILIGLNRNGGNDFGASFFFGRLLGYTFVTPVGVSRVDQNDHYISALTGSVMGMLLLTRVIDIDSAVDERSDMWALLASSVIGATIMSELSRYAPAASRLSLGVAPDRRGGLYAFAALRF